MLLTTTTLLAMAAAQAQVVSGSSYTVAIVAVSLVLISSILLWNVTLWREVQRRTASLESSEERYRSIFQGSPVATCEEDFSGVHALLAKLRADGVEDLRHYIDENPEFPLQAAATVRVLAVNQRALVLLEADDQDEPLGNLDRSATPEFREVFVEELVAIWDGQMRFRSETVIRTMKGRERHVLLSLVMVTEGQGRNHAWVSFVDLSVRKAAEEALRESEFRLKLALEGAEDGVWDWEIASGAMVLDERSAGILGLELADAPRHFLAWQDLTHPDDRGLVRRKLDAHVRGLSPHYSSEHRIRTRAGEWRWVHEVGKVVQRDPRGAPLRMTGTLKDINHRRKSEEERKQLEEQIRRAEKLESLEVLAGGIAHDFNNLLMGIMGHVDLAMSVVDPESPVRESLEQIEVVTRRAADLSAQMLAYSGKGQFVIEAVDLTTLVEEMLDILRVSIAKGIDLRVDLEKDLPAILADATQIRQVVLNLITNASDAIGSDSGVIEIRTGCMECDRADLEKALLGEGLRPGGYVLVEVTDTGRGMTDETRQRIFDPFFTTKFTGRGLGLAALLGIVRGHKGSVRVESAPGEGTRFQIFIPASKQVVKPKRPVHTRQRRPRAEGGKILFADDERTVRKVAKKSLERSGFEVVTAKDGEEAVAIFAAQAGAIDAVVLDSTMPRLDGEGALSCIRRIDANTPVILSSGFSKRDIAARLVGKGMADFIQKPYRTADLVEKLEALLDGSRKN